MNLQKILATAGSQNFFVSLISLFLLSFELNGLSTGADPNGIYEALASGEIGRITSILLLNFLNPILKLVQNSATWSWDFLKSKNFLTQAATAVLSAVTLLGIEFPDGAAAEVVDGFFGGTFETVAVALVINVLNPLWHFFFDREDPQLGEEEPIAQHPNLRV